MDSILRKAIGAGITDVHVSLVPASERYFPSKGIFI